MIKTGIVGAGGMASYHLAGFRKAGADVVAIADADQEKASKFAAKNDIPIACESISQMIKKVPGLQAISVITPNKFHHPLVIEGLNSGLHVYCEKPPAINAAQMEEMYQASIKAGKTLMFAFNNRARPESQAMIKYIKDGTVGTINSAQASWIRRTGIPGFGGWFTNKALAGGGPVIDLLHMLDLALYFMDYPDPAYVLGRTFDDFIQNPAFKGPWGIPDAKGGVTDVETSCHAMITFKTGQCLMLRNSWAEMNEREVVSVVFQGTKAGGKVERLFGIDGLDETSIDSCCLYTEENGNQVNREIIAPKDEDMGRLFSAQNFIQSITGKAKPFNTADQAVKLMKITDAIYASSSTGKPVAL